MIRPLPRLVAASATLLSTAAFAQQPPALPPNPTPPPVAPPPDAAPPLPEPPQAEPPREGHPREGHGRRPWMQHGERPWAQREPSPREAHQRDEERVITTVTSGSKNAILERQVSTQESFGHVAIALPLHTHTEVWQQVCVAPCKVDLSRASSYRVSASNGVPGTPAFTLTPNKSELDLQVRPGNLARYAAGGTLTGLGIGAFITGAVLFTAAGKFEDEKEVRIAGAITGGAGIALLAVGIPLVLMNRTHVYADGIKLVKRAPQRGPRFGLGGMEF